MSFLSYYFTFLAIIFTCENNIIFTCENNIIFTWENNIIFAITTKVKSLRGITNWAHDQLSRHLRHVTGNMPLFAQKSCHEDTIWQNTCRSSDTPACRVTVVILPANWILISGSYASHVYLVTNIHILSGSYITHKCEVTACFQFGLRPRWKQIIIHISLRLSVPFLSFCYVWNFSLLNSLNTFKYFNILHSFIF